MHLVILPKIDQAVIFDATVWKISKLALVVIIMDQTLSGFSTYALPVNGKNILAHLEMEDGTPHR